MLTWCSIVGATVTVHQFFRILHGTRLPFNDQWPLCPYYEGVDKCRGKTDICSYRHIFILRILVQRRAARFATGDYQRTSSVTSMLQQLQWQSLQTRRERTQVVMLYRIVYRLVDIPAESYLQPASLWTRGHTLRFLVPHTRTTVYKTSFFPQAIRLWNKLPGGAVEAKTLDSFKTQLSSAAQQ